MHFWRRKPTERELNTLLENLHKQVGVDATAAAAWAEGYKHAARKISFVERVCLLLFFLLLIGYLFFPNALKFVGLSCAVS